MRCLIDAFKDTYGVAKQYCLITWKLLFINQIILNEILMWLILSFINFQRILAFPFIDVKFIDQKQKVRLKCIDELKVYNNEIETINDVINIIKKLEIKINSNINHGTGFVPNNLFLRYEINELNKNKINDVIATKYLQNKIYRKVNNQALISFDNNLYSVPKHLINKEVKVIIEDNKMTIDYIW